HGHESGPPWTPPPDAKCERIYRAGKLVNRLWYDATDKLICSERVLEDDPEAKRPPERKPAKRGVAPTKAEAKHPKLSQADRKEWDFARARARRGSLTGKSQWTASDD